jgi:hypothetical protein
VTSQEGASLIPCVAMSKEFRPWKIDEAPASATERAGLCAAGPRFAVDRVAGQGKP